MMRSRFYGALLSQPEMLMVGTSSNAALKIAKQMGLRDMLYLCARLADCAEAELRTKGIIKPG